MKLGSLVPRAQDHLVLARPLGSPVALYTVPAEFHRVTSTDDPHFAALAAFADGIGFPTGWAADMLADRAGALLALDPVGGAAMAMAWSTTHPFHVEEIGATFDPRGGAYLFGDFVAPEHRGKKLQRALVSHRLAAARDEGVPFAYTLIHPDNAASLRSYDREGFVPAARFTRYYWLGKSWCRCTQPSAHSGTDVPRFKIDPADTLSPV